MCWGLNSLYWLMVIPPWIGNPYNGSIKAYAIGLIFPSPTNMGNPPWELINPRSHIWMFPKIVGFPPKSSILIGFSIINHPFWGTIIFGNIHIKQTFGAQGTRMSHWLTSPHVTTSPTSRTAAQAPSADDTTCWKQGGCQVHCPPQATKLPSASIST